MKIASITALLPMVFGFVTVSAFQPSLKSVHRLSPLMSTNDLYTPSKTTNNFSTATPQKSSKIPLRAVDAPVLVQGGSLRTWSYKSPLVEQVQVVLSTEGRPLDADIELWNGPDNTPCKMRVYVENGNLRPFSAVIETPRAPNTVAIRNIGQLEFPFTADVYTNDVEEPSLHH